MTEIWHGRRVHGPIEGCSDGCGARYGPHLLPVIHSEGCPNRKPDQNGKAPVGSVEEMYWWPRKEKP